MLPLLEIPTLLFLIALQFSALRRVSRFWIFVRCVLTASMLVAIPLLLYLHVTIEKSERTISAAGFTSVTVGPFFEPSQVMLQIDDRALAAAILIAACGLIVGFANFKTARLLRLCEIAAWLAFVAGTSAILLLIIFTRNGFHH
jgi:hypothetical protein